MEMAKQDTTKTSFLTLSGSKIGIVVKGILPKTEGDYDVNDLIFISLNDTYYLMCRQESI